MPFFVPLAFRPAQLPLKSDFQPPDEPHQAVRIPSCRACETSYRKTLVGIRNDLLCTAIMEQQETREADNRGNHMVQHCESFLSNQLSAGAASSGTLSP